MAKKWKLKGTITFYAHDFVSDAEDKLDALYDLINSGMFDIATCAIKLDDEKCKCEEVE